MKKPMFALAAMCAAVVLAADQAPTNAPTMMLKGPDGKMHQVRKIDRAKLNAAIYHKTGGKIKEPGVQKGKLVYVNCQKAADAAIIKNHAAYFAKELKIEIETAEGAFDLAKPELRGDASLFIVDDPKLPMSLFAPEAKWGMINVSPLKTEKAAFFEARVKKELTRGFCFLAGAVASQYPEALTEGVTKPEDLDRYVDEILPIDIMQRFPTYLKGYGIAPYRLISYRKACQAGWAPNPTDDVQRVIWNKVHEVPTKPIKIEYDSKKGE